MDSFDEQIKHIIIKAISFPLSMISFFSTLFVFYLYLFHKKLQIFPFRLIVYLQISDLILSFSQVLILFEDNDINDSNFLCQIQAFFMEYGILGTITWSVIITSLMIFSFSYNTSKFEKYENLLVVIGFHFTGVIAVMS